MTQQLRPYVSFIIRDGQVESMTEPSFYIEKAKDRFLTLLKKLSVYPEDYIWAELSLNDPTASEVSVVVRDLTVQFMQVSYIDLT